MRVYLARPHLGSCTSYNMAPNGPNCVIKTGTVSMLCRCMLMLGGNEQRITLSDAQIKCYSLQGTKLYCYPQQWRSQQRWGISFRRVREILEMSWSLSNFDSKTLSCWKITKMCWDSTLLPSALIWIQEIRRELEQFQDHKYFQRYPFFYFNHERVIFKSHHDIKEWTV